MNIGNTRIFLDIDDVIFDWHTAYAKKFNVKVPKRWIKSSPTFDKRLAYLRTQKDFWLTLPIKNVPNFQPKGFVSARKIPKSWTRESLKINNIPGRGNISQVPWGCSKISILQEQGCDIFIDDRYDTFKECHEAGIFCLLMNAPHNQHIKTKYRIYDLDINTIMSLWQKLK